MESVKFISYDGTYPCLCMGTLTIKIKGKTYKLKNCLLSGGSVRFDENWEAYVTSGDWELRNLPEELIKYQKEITQLVNDNVPYGCCGGCI